MCGYLTTNHWNPTYILNWATHICQNTAPKTLSKAYAQNNGPIPLQKHTQGARVYASVCTVIHKELFSLSQHTRVIYDIFYGITLALQLFYMQSNVLALSLEIFRCQTISYFRWLAHHSRGAFSSTWEKNHQVLPAASSHQHSLLKEPQHPPSPNPPPSLGRHCYSFPTTTHECFAHLATSLTNLFLPLAS